MRSHRINSLKPQLVACLVLKEFFTTDYRGIVGILEDARDLAQVLELTAIPHYTTLHKSSETSPEEKSHARVNDQYLNDRHSRQTNAYHHSTGCIRRYWL